MNVKAGRDPALGTAPVGKLFWKLALPAIAAQLVNVLYNIVDRIYIGHIPVYGAARYSASPPFLERLISSAMSRISYPCARQALKRCRRRSQAARNSSRLL